MKFLPIEINNKKVHAGFGKRFGSAVVDVLVLIPIFAAFDLIKSSSLSTAMISLILWPLLVYAYYIYFHYKFGATLGKMAFGIKVTLPNGEKIGLKQAFLRSSVDLVFILVTVVAEVIAISKADPEVYHKSSSMEQAEHFTLLLPVWYGAVNIASGIWSSSEFIVLLFNKRKRALHDLIAGTVVIRKEYADQGAHQEAATAAPVS